MLVIVGKQLFEVEVDFKFSQHVTPYNWRLNNGGYAFGWVNGEDVAMHRHLWAKANGTIPDGLTVDHINGDRLDNRLENLRLATPTEQNHNQVCHRNGQPIGVNFNKQKKKWHARYTKNGKQVHIGLFDSMEEASKAYQDRIAGVSE